MAPGNLRWFKRILMATLLLNLLDGILTLICISLGLAVEANPLMLELLKHGPTTFMAIKLLIVGLGVTLLWRFRQRPMALLGGCTTTLAYSLLLIWHIYVLSNA